jgi:hypothetical protein
MTPETPKETETPEPPKEIKTLEDYYKMQRYLFHIMEQKRKQNLY